MQPNFIKSDPKPTHKNREVLESFCLWRDDEGVDLNRRVEWVLYAVLLVLVGVVGYLQSVGGTKRKETEDRRRVPADTLMLARYAVGTRELLDANGETSNRALVAKLEDSAANSGDRLRVVILRAELFGSASALESLNAFGPAAAEMEADLTALRNLYSPRPAALSEAQRQGLLERHGWFGQLALSHGLEADAPLRVEVLDSAKRTVMAMGALLGGLSLMMALGAGLLIWAYMAYSQGRFSSAYPAWAAEHAPPNTAFLEVLILLLVTMAPMSMLINRFPMGMAPIFQLLPLLLVFWLRWRLGSHYDVLRALGWHRGQGFLREMRAGLLGYLAGLPVMAMGLALTLLLSRYATTQPSHPITEMFGDASWPRLLVLFALACVGAPLVEETLFRGAFYHHLRRGTGFVAAGLIQGCVFAAIHPQGWVALPALASIGFVFAGIREWRGSLIGPMTAHSLNNGLVMLLTVFLLT